MNIALVGEAWGEHEEKARAPFVGPSGYILTKMLEEAGIHRAQCYLTNVFNLRPRPTNDVENLCSAERSGGFPALRAGKYLKEEYFPEVHRVIREIRDLRPNITVLLGATACWAFLHNTAITKLRGTVTYSTALPKQKCLPAYHPAYVMRSWDQRPVTVLDLIKAKRESEYPEVRRPERTIYIEPTIEDLRWYNDNFLASATKIAFDIETSGDQITVIGFAPDDKSAIVVPFYDARKPGTHYWPTAEHERMAWAFVRNVLASDRPKVAQNGLYDLYFLWRSYGITVRNCEDDTMLLHHALQPESEKGLGFLGSVYTNESSWKLIRSPREKQTIKRDE